MKRFIAALLLLTFVAGPVSLFIAKPAQAEQIWYFGKIEDPRLKRLVNELKETVKILWRMFWSFEWIQQPSVFYEHLKRLFVGFYETMTELSAILMQHIRQLENEVAHTQCANRACTKMGSH